jgi:hypothetical protein
VAEDYTLIFELWGCYPANAHAQDDPAYDRLLETVKSEDKWQGLPRLRCDRWFNTDSVVKSIEIHWTDGDKRRRFKRVNRPQASIF